MELSYQNIFLKTKMGKSEKFKKMKKLIKMKENQILKEKVIEMIKNLILKEKQIETRTNPIQEEKTIKIRKNQKIIEKLNLKTTIMLVLLEFKLPWGLLDLFFILLTVSSLIVILEIILDDLVYLYSIIVLLAE